VATCDSRNLSDAEKSIVQIDDDELATLRANASVCDAATVRLRATLRAQTIGCRTDDRS
jgi:hypothetical protein